jgi:hypothetical protein
MNYYTCTSGIYNVYSLMINYIQLYLIIYATKHKKHTIIGTRTAAKTTKIAEEK